jgi:hypothetical protein
MCFIRITIASEYGGVILSCFQDTTAMPNFAGWEPWCPSLSVGSASLLPPYIPLTVPFDYQYNLERNLVLQPEVEALVVPKFVNLPQGEEEEFVREVLYLLVDSCCPRNVREPGSTVLHMQQSGKGNDDQPRRGLAHSFHISYRIYLLLLFMSDRIPALWSEPCQMGVRELLGVCSVFVQFSFNTLNGVGEVNPGNMCVNLES